MTTMTTIAKKAKTTTDTRSEHGPVLPPVLQSCRPPLTACSLPRRTIKIGYVGFPVNIAYAARIGVGLAQATCVFDPSTFVQDER
jgi:hypothetical protein